MSDITSVKYAEICRCLYAKKERLLHRKERLSLRLIDLENKRDALNQYGFWSIGYFTAMVREIEDQIDDIDDLFRAISRMK